MFWFLLTGFKGVRNSTPFVHKDMKCKIDQTVCRPLYLSFELLLIIPENILKTAVLRPVKLNHRRCLKFQNQQTRELISARTTSHKRRPESPTVTLTWHASKYKVNKLNILEMNMLSEVVQLLSFATCDETQKSLTVRKLYPLWIWVAG